MDHGSSDDNFSPEVEINIGTKRGRRKLNLTENEKKERINKQKKTYEEKPEAKSRKLKFQKTEKRKKSRQKYEISEKGQLRKLEYENSEEGKRAREEYENSEAGKKAREEYENSEEGKKAREEYENSEEGKKAREEYEKSPTGKSRKIISKRKLKEKGDASVKAAISTLHRDQIDAPTPIQLHKFNTEGGVLAAEFLFWERSGLINSRASNYLNIPAEHPLRVDDGIEWKSINEIPEAYAEEFPTLLDTYTSIGAPLTDQDYSDIINRIQEKHWNPSTKLFACACCGILGFHGSEMEFERHDVYHKDSILTKYLRLDEQEIINHDNFGEYKNVCSIITNPSNSSDRYFLHPELVDKSNTESNINAQPIPSLLEPMESQDELEFETFQALGPHTTRECDYSALICSKCVYYMKSKKRAPPLSVKYTDFLKLQRHPDLEPLTDIELMVLQIYRVYGLQYVISPTAKSARTFSGHCISFIQSNTDSLYDLFDSWSKVLDNVVENITVIFIGRMADYESCAKSRIKEFEVSSKKILSYYRALTVIFNSNNCNNQNSLPWSSINTSNLTEQKLIDISVRIDNLHEELMNKMIVSHNEDLIAETTKIGSSYASANEFDDDFVLPKGSASLSNREKFSISGDDEIAETNIGAEECKDNIMKDLQNTQDMQIDPNMTFEKKGMLDKPGFLNSKNPDEVVTSFLRHVQTDLRTGTKLPPPRSKLFHLINIKQINRKQNCKSLSAVLFLLMNF